MMSSGKYTPGMKEQDDNVYLTWRRRDKSPIYTCMHACTHLKPLHTVPYMYIIGVMCEGVTFHIT